MHGVSTDYIDDERRHHVPNHYYVQSPLAQAEVRAREEREDKATQRKLEKLLEKQADEYFKGYEHVKGSVRLSTGMGFKESEPFFHSEAVATLMHTYAMSARRTSPSTSGARVSTRSSRTS